MEENAILSNVVIILCKDLLFDKMMSSNLTSASQFPLLRNSSNEDEDIQFYLERQQLLGRNRKLTKYKPGVKLPKTCSPVVVSSTPLKTPIIEAAEENNCKQQTVEINLINELHDFESHMHMKKLTFLQIFQSVRRLTHDFPLKMLMSPQSVFSLSLWKLATDEHFEKISCKFNIPSIDCHATIRKFIQLISRNSKLFVDWPTSAQNQQNTLRGFRSNSRLKYLPNLFGVIAIRHLNIFFESLDEEIPAVLQIVCDVDQRITTSFVELVSNYRFEDTPIGQRLAQQTMPAQSYLVGDHSFPLKEYLMRPFLVASNEREVHFNNMLQPALQLGQRTLDDLSRRFHILYAPEARDLHEIREIVDTVCALHNLCVDFEDDCVEDASSVDRIISPTANESVQIVEEHIDGLVRRKKLVDHCGISD